ncbi:hypothetical protein AV274_2228 [Blastocystis sp. ATCC 50177/Nand II]|uniref:Uncharacterized protein n=1 Tax=Blastocystis sp. subtype 1 (strain ATCC 50177 / NandII) TaxID=478820 RepID=A0A196SIN6_BLAHN|nr:hypothetical protein AV274_2228 [Blastocystis sp. ATCC 50177/Nand II]
MQLRGLLFFLLFTAITAVCKGEGSSEKEVTESMMVGREEGADFKSELEKYLADTDFDSSLLSASLFWPTDGTDIATQFIEKLDSVDFDTLLLLLPENVTTAQSCMIKYFSIENSALSEMVDDSLVAYLSLQSPIEVRKQTVQSTSRIVTKLESALKSFSSPFRFLFLSITNCNCYNTHALALTLRSYPKRIFPLSISFLPSVHLRSTEMTSILTQVAEAVSRGNPEELCAKQRDDSVLNWAGIATALSFASFFDARYVSSSASIFIPFLASYGTHYSSPIDYEIVNPDVEYTLNSLVAHEDFKDFKWTPALKQSFVNKLNAFPELMKNRCVMLTWYDSAGTLVFRNGCIFPNDSSSLDLLLLYLEQAFSTMDETTRSRVTRIVFSVVFPMREVMLAPERMEVKEKAEVMKTRELLIELPIRDLSAVAKEDIGGAHSVYLVSPNVGGETLLAAEIRERAWTAEEALEELCRRLELSEDCWRSTSNALFIYRTADYVLSCDL